MAWEQGEVSVLINRPVDEVFAYAENVEKLTHWAGVEEATITSGKPHELGSRLKIVTNIMGKRMEADSELVEFERNRRSTYRNEKPFPSEITMIYEDYSGKTKVTRRVAGSPNGAFRAAYPFIKKKIFKEATKMMDNLKEALERRVSAQSV
ncbi:SRPBCC family protein [Alicyclobacillus sp. SO9]|uniref:SRPBCC family protein n=1 Tax=Alicyclobacillus sp. SO9 TaxID=2665646 RepID=UPI0018E7B88B|nr:SRPBCC family protein [Alicyclobacillus sp. SO9]QQE79118.1 SRPBCC family protein [Alicyclobacillus sp. SO9]